MNVYKSKYGKLPGSSYSEVMRAARREYRAIQKHTPRRQPYIRSKYFTKDKIFVNEFWNHLNQKVPADRLRRLKLLACAIDLARNNTFDSAVMQNPSKSQESLHRFAGQTKDGEIFYVQIKENKKTNRKDFMSVFPGK